MTTADEFEAEYGSPVFQTTFQAFAEGLDGNGILDSGDLQVTAGATSNGLDVAATTRGVLYGGTVYTYGGGTDVLTLSANSSGSDRWDLVYFDTGTTSPGVREGTPATKPDLPLLQAGEFPLAAVYVADGQTDVTDSEIRSLRVHAGDASETYVDDSPGLYAGDTVESALTSELQYAAQLTGYPLPLADLSSPYALPSITDMDANGTDLTDSAGPGVLYDASAGVFLQSVLGGPASSLSAYPLSIATDTEATAYPLALADLASPFALPSITDMDAAGNDLVDGGTTVWDTSEGHVPRPQVDDQKQTTTVSTATATTADEEVVFVQTSTIGAASTITLASTDATDGNTIVVTDVEGAASDNPITVDTEGSETIAGATSKTIETDGGALVFTSNGTNWSLGGGGAGGGAGLTVESIATDASGTVNTGDLGILHITNVPDGSALEVTQASLLLADGQPAPTGLDLIIGTLDNAGNGTSETTLITGDGSTVYDDETGSPLGSFSNSSGSATTVFIGVDNGNFNTGSGSNQEMFTDAIGEVV